MEKTNLESFAEKVFDYSLSLIDEKGVYAEDFEKSVLEYLSGIFPHSNNKNILSLYNVFQWELVCNPEAPFDFVFPEKEGEKTRILFNNGVPDTSELTKKMLERYSSVLSERIEKNLN